MYFDSDDDLPDLKAGKYAGNDTAVIISWLILIALVAGLAVFK